MIFSQDVERSNGGCVASGCDGSRFPRLQAAGLRFRRVAGYGALVLSAMALTTPVFAGAMGYRTDMDKFRPWTVTGSIGYTNYSSMFDDDGQTTLGRFAIGWDFFIANEGTMGLEVGVQNGNTMRLKASQHKIDALGGLPIMTTAKPMPDLLLTVRASLSAASSWFVVFKGGAAYRRWQFNDRDSIEDKSQLAGEVQGGLGFAISPNATLSLSYQGIFGASPDFRINEAAETGRVSNIPEQNGVLLGLTMRV